MLFSPATFPVLTARGAQRMPNPLNYPLLILVLSLVIFWASSSMGTWLRRRTWSSEEENDFKFVLGGTLTLLGLIIGFTFSMAVSRYDQRKFQEADEANAIGTEYDRAPLLPSADAAKVRVLLKSYLDLRISNYASRDQQRLTQIVAETDRLQTEMWALVISSAGAHPSALTALTVAGMNNVLDSQGYAQAAWSNRIPISAWTLLIIMSMFCNLLIGFGFGAVVKSPFVFLILPVALSISLFLIADIDSPRRGVIRVIPQNLETLAASLDSR